MDKSYKIAGLVLVLLGIMVATTHLTGTTLEDISPNKTKSSVGDVHNTGMGSVKLPGPAGPKGAAVQIKVYVTSDNTCDTTTVQGMQDIAKRYSKDVRLEFVDILDPAKAKEAQKAKISCKSGMTINGLSAMRIPGRGVKGLVMFDGPIGKQNYGLAEVEAGVKQLIAAKGKGKSKKSK